MLRQPKRKKTPFDYFFLALFCLLSATALAQPANDNCAAAGAVVIGSNGFAIGTFSSATIDISNATIQTNESFAPAILVAGQSQKSIWYKFTIPTTRAVRVTLAQSGNNITAGDVGFAVYKTNSCLPGNPQISTKLTPIALFGNTYHPCVDSGEYYVQVSAKNSAKGQVLIQVETALPTAAYDQPKDAADYGTLKKGIQTMEYTVECQSIEDENERCEGLSNNKQYNKSTWHVFKTPAYFDLIGLMFSHVLYSNQKFGLKIYEGDVRTGNYKTLPVTVSCDSLVTTTYYFARKVYKCGIFKPEKTYSIQILYPQNFNSDVKLAMVLNGTAPTQAPVPVLTGMPATNNIGTLKADRDGELTQLTDYLGCNSRHSQTACGSALPKDGFLVTSNNWRYSLSTFFTFKTTVPINLSLSAYAGPYDCSGSFYMRLYKQAPTATCAGLDTANIIAANYNSITQTCLPAGNYTIQVMGRDSLQPENQYYYHSFGVGHTPYYSCLQSELGNQLLLNITASEVTAANHYALNKPGAYDTLGAVNGAIKPLVSNTTYPARRDTFGCQPTVLPDDAECTANSNRAIFRQMQVADSGMLIMGGSYHFSRLYKGDANALATAQSAFAHPARITGLTPYGNCYQYGGCDSRACLVPGTYTHVSFGNDNDLSREASHNFIYRVVKSQFNSLAKAENMGTITSQKTSAVDVYDCYDNAKPINGVEPCRYYNTPTTKAIYRTFFLEAEARVSISGNHYNNDCGYTGSGVMTLFYGKATDGEAGLKPVGGKYACFMELNASQCDQLPAGWYTLVTYGGGSTYSEPLRNSTSYAGTNFAGRTSQVTIILSTACPSPKYNRPAKAAIDTLTNQPFLLQWGPRVGHTAAYPKTDTTITLYRENFNCTVDTPFLNQVVPFCDPSSVKAAFYVFRTTQEAYVQINAQYYWAAVYAGNARNGNMKFDSSNLIQPCISSYPGNIQLNRLQPGTYTLVIFARTDHNCTSIEPTLYIDRIAYSRFDHARNAYDFGVVPSDSLWHNGKPGDVNPLNKDRAPSDDFFYSTTGARTSDPTDISCGSDVYPKIYDNAVNNPLFQGNSYFALPKRNLWYTFVIKDGGTVRVKVNSRTKDKTSTHRYAVYRSDADGNLSFAQLAAAGEIDSTKAQGLTMVVTNAVYYCYYNTPEVTFYREPCSPKPERYYILVESVNEQNDYGMKPANQLDVQILVDSVNAIQPKFDHYSTASNIGTNLGNGTYKGETDNFSCATRNAKDPVYSNYSCGSKTLWYKFSTKVTGNIRFRMVYRNGTATYSAYSWTDISLYREVIAGDSTDKGLEIMNTSNAGTYVNNDYWGVQCVSPGTYYILLTGCNRVDEFVYPEIDILEQAGDFCSAPVIAALSGAGAKTATTTVTCHTIGTDYGEFNPTLTCPNGALKGDYKTTWYRIDISGKDTLDVTTFLTENTNAGPAEIKYRMMEGTCGAMQERSCVQDAQTRDTYKCLPPGSYYIQVFTPVRSAVNNQMVVGDITLNLSAVKHVDTCAPLKTCLSTAVFLPQYDCTKSDVVSFTNLSTYGTNIQYQWDFGWNGQTSTAVSPALTYPVLDVDKTYTIKLRVTNNNCPAGTQNTDETSTQITIPARPKVDLGRDTVLCTPGATLKLNAATWSGTTYYWSNGQTSSSIDFSSMGYPYDVTVVATYKGCIKRDTIKVAINPIEKRNQTTYLCREDSVQLSDNRGYNETHLWSTGETNYYIYAKKGGLYVNYLNWRGCTIKDSFTVIRASQPFPKEDTLVCPPFRSFKLNIAAPGATNYYWENGSGSSEFTVSQPGTYWAQVYYPNCTFRDTIVVKQSPATITFSRDTTLCQGQSLVAPWGQLLTKTGTYRDTVRYNWGCDSLVQTINLKVITTATNTVNTSICNGSSYTLPWGPVVSAAGIYRDTLRSRAGCDSVLRIVNLQVNRPVITNTAASICQGQTYTLPWGKIVSTTGSYSDTLRHKAGCDSVIRTVDLRVQPRFRQQSSAVICQGQSYTLPWGEKVSTSGTFTHVIKYASGCDSLIQEVDLRVTTPQDQTTLASICEGSRYTLPWGPVVSTAGLYRDTLRTAAGCDSVRRTVDLVVSLVRKTTEKVVLCQGQTYTLPNGEKVNSDRTFTDTLRSVIGGCDSLIRAFEVRVQSTSTLSLSPTICEGESYLLPWGQRATVAGTYRDTLRYDSGCDSLFRIVTLRVNNLKVENLSTTLCQGNSYLLPWGQLVSAAGIYRDTLRYTNGCDSVRRTVEVQLATVRAETSRVTLCAGQRYTLPWGATISASGTYQDTLRYAGGCDSLRRTVEVTVNAPSTLTTAVSICSGQRYTLPWGESVSTSGTYKDTLTDIFGCDSLIRSYAVKVNETQTVRKEAFFCQGNAYTLPWGMTVASPGEYRDTLRYANGCDSVITVVNLSERLVRTEQFTPFICEGSRYTLPWGGMVSAAGTYRDTLRYTSGCDSLIRVVTLSVQAPVRQSTSALICQGNTYTLPWGEVVRTAGTYRDTLRYTSGCDSLLRTVALAVQAPTSLSTNVIRCQGESYTLPWGRVVSASGTYQDTLRYQSGCDSLLRVYTLTFRTTLTQRSAATLCQGQTYTLPWGRTVSATGEYRDTLRYPEGCDSLVRIIDLEVKEYLTQSTTAILCQGEQYTLPWGPVVSTSGTYRDTLRYRASGCDSVRRSVTVVVQGAQTQTSAPTICQGASYTLPWGEVVRTAGTYRDTLRYTSGCDSVLRVVTLRVQEPSLRTTEALICEGGRYRLPWGVVVFTEGTYRDTLRYSTTGCDSLLRVVHLSVQRVQVLTTEAVICQGGAYPLPWGGVVSTAGTYSDTLRYTSGCDSVVRTVNLRVTAPQLLTTRASICSDGRYTLPWGGFANQSGTYRDTVRTQTGCDSLVREVVLEVRQAPQLTLSKSNDIDCMLGTARLKVSGASRYTWSPAASLNNAQSSTPQASPTTTTLYQVQATADNGCTAQASLEVKVKTGDPANGYLVPSAFTPNGDGKNDCFGVRHWGAVENLQMTIYNRWGGVVFQTTDITKCWDGTFAGQPEGSATFVYVISANTNCGRILRKGAVNLIR